MTRLDSVDMAYIYTQSQLPRLDSVDMAYIYTQSQLTRLASTRVEDLNLFYGRKYSRLSRIEAVINCALQDSPSSSNSAVRRVLLVKPASLSITSNRIFVLLCQSARCEADASVQPSLHSGSSALCLVQNFLTWHRSSGRPSSPRTQLWATATCMMMSSHATGGDERDSEMTGLSSITVFLMGCMRARLLVRFAARGCSYQ